MQNREDGIIFFRLDAEKKNVFAALCKKERTSISHKMRELVAAWVKRQEKTIK